MAAPKSTPRDAQVMTAILKDMGILDYEPRLVNQMLEFAYRYITDVLDDAKVYSNYASKKNIDAEDVRLAVHCRMDQSFTTPPPKDMLMEIARQKNSQALPLIKPYSVPRLPPDRNCITSTNFKLVAARSLKKHPRIQIGLQGSQFPSSAMSGQRISLASYQQSMASKVSGGGTPTLTVVTKGVSLPTVTFLNKPSKPTIRLSTGHSLSSTPSISTLPGSSLVSGTVAGTSIVGAMPGTSLVAGNTSIMSVATTQQSQLMSMDSNPLKRKLDSDENSYSKS
ncbi:hypothetical protein ScPMuIL_018639 [Solemya velum]